MEKSSKITVRKHNKLIIDITMAAMCLALCLLLPFLTGQIPQIGQALSPMHIPVLLCGFICGPVWGAAVGFIAPLLRFLLFSMPPIYPTGVAMAFELAAYGLMTGLLWKLVPKKIPYVYITLISSMLIGRLVWGVVRFLISMISLKNDFTFAAFLAGAFTGAVPGIICHIILIPLIVIALMKTKFIESD